MGNGYDALRRWRIGVVGLGKVGMPIALAISLKGHHVMGYDVNPERMQKEHFSEQERGPNGEPSIEPLLRESELQFGSLAEVVKHSELIICAIQTPHTERYEGVTRLPISRVDFDYTFLKKAIFELQAEIAHHGAPKIVVIMSTVLPGTLRREIIPWLDPLVKLCYNPFFIAMGTTIEDFLNPEFVLFGVENKDAAAKAKAFYRTLHNRPFYETTIENAELIKVAYNTYITTKVCVANTLMEICHRIPGCDVDGVTKGLALATDRLWSPKYTRGGMGDGGGCHPRDNIAMSYLARELDLSFDWFQNLMLCREQQAEWLAELAVDQCERAGTFHIGILGKAFKPETNLTAGSPATLVANLLRERGYAVEQWDPKVDGGICPFAGYGVILVATQHDCFRQYKFTHGSIVIDPFRYIPEQPGVEVIHVGIGKHAGARQFATAG